MRVLLWTGAAGAPVALLHGIEQSSGWWTRKGLAMKAYVIAAETIKDQAMFDAYRKEVVATLAPFGGQFIVRGGNMTILEGEWPHPRLVILEFPSRAAAEGWYRSAEYQKVISLRLKSSVGNLIIVDGFA
jgi:uncharacterized protein (DUF1330 family)